MRHGRLSNGIIVVLQSLDVVEHFAAVVTKILVLLLIAENVVGIVVQERLSWPIPRWLVHLLPPSFRDIEASALHASKLPLPLWDRRVQRRHVRFSVNAAIYFPVQRHWCAILLYHGG